jgi:hypothetical protein
LRGLALFLAQLDTDCPIFTKIAILKEMKLIGVEFEGMSV